MEADGVPFTPLPLSVLCFMGIWTYSYTDKGKSKQTLKSPRIEPGDLLLQKVCTNNWATPASI